MPGFDQVGISTVDKRGKIETKAVTGDLVLTLDRIQYDLGEGPCYDTLRLPDVEVVTASIPARTVAGLVAARAQPVISSPRRPRSARSSARNSRNRSTAWSTFLPRSV